MSSRILAIIRKEFIHIRRDFRTLIIIFVMPVFQLLIFGYAINMEIQKIEMVVLDHSQTPASRDFIRGFQGSKYFAVRDFDLAESEVGRLFQSRQAHVVLIIAPDFSSATGRPASHSVQILIDASDSNRALLIENYFNFVLQRYNLDRRLVPPFDVQTSIQYNPTLKSTYFFVPGLVALILIMISALLTSITIAREKETGTLEQILVSPVRPFEIVMGKVTPYIALAFMDGIIILLVAHFWFRVPFAGNVLLMLSASVVFIFVALALGILISTRVRTQQIAMMVALISTMLPTIMLSGFIFPIASMPWPLRLISYVVPARYFLQIIRGIMLKANTVMQLWVPLLVLVGMGIFLTVVSARRFKMTLEL